MRTLRLLVPTMVLVAASCGGRAAGGGGTGGSEGTGGADGGTSSDSTLCREVACGGFGTCIVIAEEPRCLCNLGYHEDASVPTCVAPSGSSASGSTTDTTGTGSATDATGSGTTSPDTSGTDASSGSGGKGPGEPCAAATECASGWCWSDWNFQRNQPDPKACQEGCIANGDNAAYCESTADCCTGECQVGGQGDGYCMGA